MLHGCRPPVAILLDLLFHFLLKFLTDSFSMVHTHLQNLKRAFNEACFDQAVNGGISAETWRMIYLEHPWL